MTKNLDRAQIYRLFAEAMDVEPPARGDFVQERCGQDAELKREIAALFAAAESDSDAILAKALQRALMVRGTIKNGGI
jgi:hypothetical protein